MNDRMHEAIVQQVAMYRASRMDDGVPDDEGVVVDWVCVVQTQSYDSDGDMQSGYYMSFSGGEMPDHRAIGLFEMGRQLVLEGGGPRHVED